MMETEQQPAVTTLTAIRDHVVPLIRARGRRQSGAEVDAIILAQLANALGGKPIYRQGWEWREVPFVFTLLEIPDGYWSLVIMYHWLVPAGQVERAIVGNCGWHEDDDEIHVGELVEVDDWITECMALA